MVLEGELVVFGANGYLGARVTIALSKAQRRVLAVVRPGSDVQQIVNLEGVQIFQIDPESWSNFLKNVKANYVLCAQWQGVDKSLRNIQSIQQQNVIRILEIANTAKSIRAKLFMTFGSQAETSPSQKIIPESKIFLSSDEYGQAKIRLLNQLENLFESSETKLVWGRVFSIYGPNNFSDTLLLNLFKSVQSNMPIEIHKSEMSWNFLYEADFSAAVMSIINSGDVNGIVNIASEVNYSIKDISSYWISLCKRQSYSISPIKSGSGYWPDITKLKSLNWESKLSLECGLAKTLESYERTTL